MTKGPGYWLIRGLMKAVGILPLRVVYAVGTGVAWCAEHMHYRRDVVLTNLSRSFPGLKYKELSRLVHGFYRSLGMIAAECIWFGAGGRDGRRFRDSRLCRLTNVEELNRLYSSSPSVMLLGGHYCNWELIGGLMLFDTGDVAPQYRESDVIVSYKQMKSAVWDQVFKDNRTAVIQNPDRYANMMETSQLVRYIAANHASHKIFQMIADQHPYKHAAGMDIEFMHQAARTMTAAGRLALKYGMSVAYLGVKRVSRGHYEYTVHTIAEDASRMSVEEIYNKFYTLLQQDIEAGPEAYLWSHKRWK